MALDGLGDGVGQVGVLDFEQAERQWGKRLDPAATRAALGWAPSHASCVQVVKGGGQDAYTRDERLRGGAAHLAFTRPPAA